MMNIKLTSGLSLSIPTVVLVMSSVSLLAGINSIFNFMGESYYIPAPKIVLDMGTIINDKIGVFWGVVGVPCSVALIASAIRGPRITTSDLLVYVRWYLYSYAACFIGLVYVDKFDYLSGDWYNYMYVNITSLVGTGGFVVLCLTGMSVVLIQEMENEK